MSNIKEFLLKAKKAYYEGEPIVSDSQYDALEEKYGKVLDVGYDLEDGFPHYARLYSLQKKYREEDTLPTNVADWVVTSKLDGASVALTYVNGKLVSALTRGDGIKGKDVFNNVKHLVPNEIVPWLSTIQIRGEVVAPKDIENSRNYAAGALSLKDEQEFLQRDLKFIAIDIYPYVRETYISDMSMIENEFNTVMNDWKTKFPTDGKVWRLNNNEKYYSLGFTNKHPRGAFALKERSEGIITTILDVVWQTGKSGKVTPVAILDPVVIEDALVSRATLNNVGFIQALNLKLGDKVLVERAGGIIPRIISKAE